VDELLFRVTRNAAAVNPVLLEPHALARGVSDNLADNRDGGRRNLDWKRITEFYGWGFGSFLAHFVNSMLNSVCPTEVLFHHGIRLWPKGEGERFFGAGR
jgi:hypothetical protein